MPKKQRQQKRTGKPSNLAQDNRPASDLQDGVTEGEDDHSQQEEGEEVNEGEGEERSQTAKSLRRFLKHAKGQHYRVIEIRVALVCSFGVFAKLIFSDALEKNDEDSFITHSAITYIGRKCVTDF